METNMIYPQRRLVALLEQYHNQVRRIDDLECRLDVRASRTRRRIQGLLDKLPPTRSSHLRVWATHLYYPPTQQQQQPQQQEPEIDSKQQLPLGQIGPRGDPSTLTFVVGGNTAAEDAQPEAPSTAAPASPKSATQQQLERFILQIEGVLLIGHLDHASLAKHDAKTGYTAPTDDLDRSKGEKEEDEVPKALVFTHFFDRLVVRFETVYQPRTNPMSRRSPVSKKKKKSSSSSSRRGSMTKSPAPPIAEEVDLRQCVMSPRTVMTWNRPMSEEDAHAWRLEYVLPPPPSGAFRVYSVVARVELYGSTNQGPSTSADQARRPSDAYRIRSRRLAEALFPHHAGGGGGDSMEETVEGESDSHETQQQQDNKKRKAGEEVSATTADGHPLPPTNNEIHVPESLTMNEIIMAFYTYIRDKKLIDDNEKSTIVCDATLRHILGVERLPYFELQQTLLQKNLVAPVTTPHPVRFTYVMNQDNASNAVTGTEMMSEERRPSLLLQLDMDCKVPALFPYRARELLRRIKRRELEYTSSRTKARYILASRRSKDEDRIKSQIDDVVSGKLLHPDLQPILLCLARGAPPRTEARTAAHLDARMSFLLERLQVHFQSAQLGWDLVDACQSLADAGVNNKDAENRKP